MLNQSESSGAERRLQYARGHRQGDDNRQYSKRVDKSASEARPPTSKAPLILVRVCHRLRLLSLSQTANANPAIRGAKLRASFVDLGTEDAYPVYMKQLLALMVEYNRVANRGLCEILKAANSGLLTEGAGSYFHSVLGLLNHILLSDLGWLTAYRDSNLELPVLESPVLQFEHPGWNKNLYDDFDELRKHREATDELLVKLIEESPEDLLEGTIEVSRRKPETRTFPFGKLIMHLLNHQSHHRGAISQILDQNQVENDFSNVIQLLRE